MKTPWGELQIADAHVHFFSWNFFRLLTEGRDPAAVCAELGWVEPPERPDQLAAMWVAELHQQGVERCALFASLPGDEPSVAAAVGEFPERFWGGFFLNPTSGGAVERLRSGMASGLKTVCLLPAMHTYPLSDPCVEELLVEAERLAATVFVHLGVLSVGVRKKLGLPSRYDMSFSNPLDLHGPALRHPGLNFIVPHFGAGFFREALMLADLCPNVYLDTSSSNAWMKYHAPELTLNQVFGRALAVVGPERLLFGTDSSYFPRGWHRPVFEQQVQALAGCGVNAEAAELILGGNLRRLMGTP
ncbi:MAG TPA: amidohydrolase family protein [Paludibaculum sp.]|jgi:hypothetical protein